LTAGTRRNGNSTFGVFKRSSHDGEHAGQRSGAGVQRSGAGVPADRYIGRHADPRAKTARKRSGKVVPAAAVAATLVAGAAAYGLVAGSGHPQAAQLSTELSLPVNLSSATHSGMSVGGVDSAASAMIKAARTASLAVASRSAKPQASRSAKAAAKPTAAPSSAPASTAPAPQTAATAQAAATQAPAAATPSPTATSQPSTGAQSSSGGSAAVLKDIANGNNTLAIGQYLVDNGYSVAAAAGVASCVDGESGANPESEGDGGGGLIGWTPLGSAQPNANIVTGDVSADMMTQLADILYYNSNEIGQSRVDELNSQTDPVAAADFFSQNFEKPAVTDSDVVPSVADEVYSELGG
jgi:Phage tail lysozyme